MYETKEISNIVFNATELALWNKVNDSYLQQIKDMLNEKVYYFKHVTLINWKVTIVAIINKFKQ